MVTRYYNAIHHGVSDTKALLPSPEDPTCSLVKRTLALVQSIRLLVWDLDKEPYLLTESWLEQASGIKRRIITNRGEDYTLIEPILAALSRMPEVKKRLDSKLSDDKSGKENEAVRLKKHFIFNHDRYLLRGIDRKVASQIGPILTLL